MAKPVVRQDRIILLPDGDVEHLDVRTGVDYIRYHEARNDQCAHCVEAQGDLQI